MPVFNNDFGFGSIRLGGSGFRGAARRGERKAAERKAEKSIAGFLRNNPEVTREDLPLEIFAASGLISDPKRQSDLVGGIIARNRSRQAAARRGLRANILTSPLGLSQGGS